jgi:hypothetical protein
MITSRAHRSPAWTVVSLLGMAFISGEGTLRPADTARAEGPIRFGRHETAAARFPVRVGGRGRVRAARAAGRRRGREHPGDGGGHRRVHDGLDHQADHGGRDARRAEPERPGGLPRAGRPAADRAATCLQDVAQQQLTCVSVRLLVVAQPAGQDPDLATLLEQLGAEVRDTAQELWSLAHGIYPPLLRANGLADALFAAASHCLLPTRVQVGSLGLYPADVEAAVCFCCLEARQNACKHAEERATVGLRVREEPGTQRGGCPGSASRV